MHLLERYIDEGEHKSQEFKVAYTRNMMKSVSAFANYHDGRIIIGVDDQGRIVGVDDPETVRLSIENTINDSIRPRPYYELEVFGFGGKVVLVYSIFKGDQTPYRYKDQAYERYDTSTVPIDRERYEELVLLGKNLTYDELPNDGVPEFKLLAERLVDSLGVSELNTNILKSLGLNKNGRWNNAAMLFADSQTNKAIGLNLIRYKDNLMTVIDDRISLEGVSIISHIDESMRFYNRYVRTKDVITDTIRRTFSEVPEVAYREAVINAIVHRDYSKQASNRIEFFNDRIEILSVGGLPVGTTEEEYLNGSYSNLRNPIIADLLFRLGYIEKMGTGIRRIKRSYIGCSVKPEFKVMKNSIIVVLPFLDENRIETEVGGNRIAYTVLEPEEEKLYEFFRVEEALSRMDIERYMNVGKTKAVELLNQLVDKKYIYKVGKGRGTVYKRI